MKRAKEKTAERKLVSHDQKQICNYGRVTYRTADKGTHTVSKVFYDRVKSLPKDYKMEDYMQFIRDYGTVSKKSDTSCSWGGILRLFATAYSYSNSISKILIMFFFSFFFSM